MVRYLAFLIIKLVYNICEFQLCFGNTISLKYGLVTRIFISYIYMFLIITFQVPNDKQGNETVEVVWRYFIVLINDRNAILVIYVRYMLVWDD